MATVDFLVGKSTTLNVVYLAKNKANYKDLLFNKMVQQTSLQTMFIFVFLLIFK